MHNPLRLFNIPFYSGMFRKKSKVILSKTINVLLLGVGLMSNTADIHLLSYKPIGSV
jgi:hypothetical protein